MVLAVTGPVDQIITEYEKAGFESSAPSLERRAEMSGREIAVSAGLLIIAIGAISEADNQHSTQVIAQGPPKVPAPEMSAPKPVPTHTVIVHEMTTHVVTKVAGGFPLAGWQIMLIAIVAVIVVAGAFVAVQLRRLS